MRCFLALPQVLILSLFLSACGGSGETDSTEIIPIGSPTYTYPILEGSRTVTETININSSGSIDLKDYLFPLEGVSILNYKAIIFSDGIIFSQEDTPEYFMINGDDIRISKYVFITDYAIQSDRIRLKLFDDFHLTPLRDSALGRFYEVGDLVYTAVTLENDLLLDSNGNPTFKVDKRCRISKALSSLSAQGYSYTGDIIEFACRQDSLRTTTNSLGGEFTNTSSRYEYTYYKKGVGKIVMSTDNCNPNNDFAPSAINSPNCPDNLSTYSEYEFLVE